MLPGLNKKSSKQTTTDIFLHCVYSPVMGEGVVGLRINGWRHKIEVCKQANTASNLVRIIEKTFFLWKKQVHMNFSPST